jgi:asparagine synthase (glutamine-hydrolysing)
MDGQEAALRLMAWMFGDYQFSNSPSSTPERLAQFTIMVAAHAERIYKNIDYALSTHGNHIISEAFGLWLVGLLFPELKDSEKYLTFGRKLLEQEAAAQIFPDGTYSMYSLNYHRFILHIYLCVLRLAELNQSPISSLIFDRVSTSIDYLSQLIDPKTGKMPVYGSNDGALVLPLNNCDFTNYRPLLQLGTYITKKQFFFEPGPWDEDIFWLCSPFSFQGTPRSAPQGGAGVMVKSVFSFPQGGTYILRGPNSKAIIRCTDYRSRPSHADQLHVDIWIRGQNIACDAGTYLYSGEGIWRNGLAHTAVHNTVTVDHQDQMKMLTRFTWTNWSHGKVLRHDEHIWQGQHDGYKRLSDPVNHKRTVISLAEDRWLILDQLFGNQPHHYALHWLLCDAEYGVRKLASAHGLWLNTSYSKQSDAKSYMQMGMVIGRGNFSIVRADPNSTRGWRSQYYGEKEPAISVILEANQPEVTFWSFFGFEGDLVQIMGNSLKINSEVINLASNK